MVHSLPIFIEIDHGVGAATDHHGYFPVESPQRLHERDLLDSFVLRRLTHRVLPGHPADRLRAVRHAVVRQDYDVHLEKGNTISVTATLPLKRTEGRQAHIFL